MEPTYEPSSDDLTILRDWIKQVPYIPQDLDDNFLSAFYRASKGSLQKTKTMIDNFTGLGYKHPELYKHLDPSRESMKEFLDVAYFFSMPKTSPTDPLLLISKLRPNIDMPEKHKVLELFRLQLIAKLLAIKEGTYGSCKIVLISDCKGLTLSHMRDMSPGSITSWTGVITNSLPVRVQGIHSVNVPGIIEWVFNIIRKVSKEKISQRTFVHTNPEGLLKHFSKELLPNELGGTGGSCDSLADAWRSKLNENRDFIVGFEESIRKLDNLRPKTIEETASGTFKKLNID